MFFRGMIYILFGVSLGLLLFGSGELSMYSTWIVTRLPYSICISSAQPVYLSVSLILSWAASDPKWMIGITLDRVRTSTRLRSSSLDTVHRFASPGTLGLSMSGWFVFPCLGLSSSYSLDLALGLHCCRAPPEEDPPLPFPTSAHVVSLRRGCSAFV